MYMHVLPTPNLIADVLCLSLEVPAAVGFGSADAASKADDAVGAAASPRTSGDMLKSSGDDSKKQAVQPKSCLETAADSPSPLTVKLKSSQDILQQASCNSNGHGRSGGSKTSAPIEETMFACMKTCRSWFARYHDHHNY